MRNLLKDKRAASGLTIATAIVGIVVGIYVFALMFPDAINTLFNVTWHADVPEGVQTLSTTVASIIGAIVFILLLLKQSG